MKTTRTIIVLLLTIVCSLLAACGGGTVSQSGQTNAGNTSVTKYTMTVALIDPTTGVQGTYFQTGATLQAKATVTQSVTTTDPSGLSSTKVSPAVGAIVVFTSDGGTFTPEAGNVITDANGVAAIAMTLGQVSGAFALNATTQGSAAGATAAINFQIQNAATPILAVQLQDSQGTPVNRIQAGAIGTVHVNAKQLTQQVGQSGGSTIPAPDVTVTVSSDGGTLDPSSGTALTDANGDATIAFQANVTQGAFTLSATATIQGASTTASMSYAVVPPPLVMGSGSPFQAGVVQVMPATVQGGTTAQASVQLTDGAGHPFTLPVTVAFTSNCATAGNATITSPVPVVNGVATTMYTPSSGCLGQDQIKAQVTLPGQSIPTTASGYVTVTAPPATGLVFVSASPQNIAIKGHGTGTHPERSTVIFTVVSANGVAVPGQAVNFALSSLAGGVSLANSSAISDNSGKVQTIVQSGSVPSTVTVQATLAGSAGSTLSGGIVISSASPQQSAFSLSATQLDIEAWNVDGVESQLTIRAADHYSNPVPDGTVVSFTADGGSITPSCSIAAGACTVTMTSQNPRPSNGRVVILATAPGDETFTDANGNGLWDTGEPFQALAEPWRDDNENAKYDVGEFFIDADNNGKWDAANTVYAGSLCNPTTYPACNPKGTYVRQQMVIVFATSAANIQIQPGVISVGNVNPVTAHIVISDGNGNLPAANSTVQIATSAGKLLTDAAYTIGDSNARGPLVLNAQIIGDGSTTGGVLTVTVTSPNGYVTTKQATVIQTVQQQLPGGIVLTPNTFNVASNQTTTLQTQATVATTAPVQPLAGVAPVVNCTPGTSTGLTLTPPASVAPTGTNGSTVIAIGAVTGAAAAGTATCTVTAGTVNATLTINAGP